MGNSVKKGECQIFWSILVIMFKIGGEIAISDLAKASKFNNL